MVVFSSKIFPKHHTLAHIVLELFQFCLATFFYKRSK